MEKERDTGPEEEARFFVSSLNYLTGGCQGKKSQTERENEVPQIKLKSLSLVGWYGVSASMILNMLLELPVLSQVQTLVKTERFDSGQSKVSFQHGAADPIQSDNLFYLVFFLFFSKQQKFGNLQI